MSLMANTAQIDCMHLCYTILFSLYAHLVMGEINELEGTNIGGRNVNNIKNTDDMVMIADSEEKLHRLVNRLQEECK